METQKNAKNADVKSCAHVHRQSPFRERRCRGQNSGGSCAGVVRCAKRPPSRWLLATQTGVETCFFDNKSIKHTWLN